MTKTELVARIACKQTHLPRRDVEAAVNLLLERMSKALEEGGRIEIRGFGTFSLHYRESHLGRNPKTGEPLSLPGKYVPHFKSSKVLRGRVNGDLRSP